MENNIFQYVTDALSDIEDDSARKRALLSIVSTLYDKGLVDFKDGKDSGYIDDLEGDLEGIKDKIDEIISNNAVVQASRQKHEEETGIGNLRGLYDLVLMPIDNVTRKVFGGSMKPDTSYDVLMAGKKKTEDRKDKFVGVMVKELQKIDQLLSEEDKRTYIAIANLLYNGKTKATPRQLYCLAMQDDNARPTEDQIKRQHASIVRMASLYIQLDVKEIVKLYPEITKIVTGGQFVKVTQWYGRTANGTYNDYYEFDGVPILFQLSLTVKQVAKIENTDKALLESPLRKTAENTAIISYIADRITALRNNSAVKCLISYDTLYKRAGINFNKYKNDQTARNKKSKTKKAIVKHVEHLKEAGILTSYDDLQTGIEISLK